MAHSRGLTNPLSATLGTRTACDAEFRFGDVTVFEG
jgi:hypothetical protein